MPTTTIPRVLKPFEGTRHVWAPVAWLALMVVAFWFLLVRPQRRQMLALRQLQAALAEGDRVVTTSGIHGRVLALGDETLDLEIAPGTVITLARGAVGQRLTDEIGGGPDAADDA